MSSTRISDFDIWRAGYGQASVRVLIAGTETDASIFSDENLTLAVTNPVTLAERIVGGVSYGKFSAPIYVGVAYELLINSIEETGVMRPPLTTLDAQDASLATVQVAGGTQDIELEDHLARRIDVRDFGAFVAVGGPGASSSTNNATIVAALAAASALGGGVVWLPAGTYALTAFTVPAGVVLAGQGRTATTLQSTQASTVVTIGGARAGLTRLTLDGVSKVGSSIGLAADNKAQPVLDDVVIERFETGIYRKGGSGAAWRELYISNCTNGAKLHGDLASAAGAALSLNHWDGGAVDTCSSFGIELKYIDAACELNLFRSIFFDTNTGTALKIIGARASEFRQCKWLANTANLSVADASPETSANTVKGVEISDGSMSGGTLAFSGTVFGVALRRMTLASLTVTLTTPENNIHIEDCIQSSITLSGDSSAWRSRKTVRDNGASVTTADAAFVKAWAATLDPGEFCRLHVRVIGRRRNGGNAFAGGSFVFSAYRPGSVLNFEAQTSGFTFGSTVTGQTSGATGVLVTATDAGTTGSLTLYDVVGEFLDDEIVADNFGGSATANGTLTHQNVKVVTPHSLPYDGQTANFTAAAILTGSTTGATAVISADADGGATGTLTIKEIHGQFIDNEGLTDSSGGIALVNSTTGQVLPTTAFFGATDTLGSTNYSVRPVGNGSQIEIRVAGTDAHTVDWIVDVDMTTYPVG